MASIANNWDWEALSGVKDNWTSISLDPIDNNLRLYLYHYGERVGATGEAFNGAKASKSYGFPLYPQDELFTQVSLQNGNPFKYEVTKYFYASEAFVKTAWIGYVAVATDEGKLALGRRDIMVCWRGTMLTIEEYLDMDCLLTSASSLFPDTNSNPKVHQGFLSIYTQANPYSIYSKASARTQVLNEIRRLVNLYAAAGEDVSITIAGHSLGGALAILNAMDIVYNKYNVPTGSNTAYPVTAFTYASPQVGEAGFLEVFNGLSDNLHLLCIKNAHDIIPTIIHDQINSDYVDVGTPLSIDFTTSPYLKDIKKLSDDALKTLAHQLEIYLHAIAGYKGDGDNFKNVIDRDVALVNKHLDILVDNCNVPPQWWVLKYKGMVQMDTGYWKRFVEYFPDPPTDVEEATTSE